MVKDEISSVEMSIYDINSEWYGVPRYNLMENAGANIANFIRSILASENENIKSIAIFCGSGGNGGDGMVVARHLYHQYKVTVFLLGRPERISSKPAQKNWKTLQKLQNLEKRFIFDSQDIEKIKWEKFDLIIDAILGAGLKSEPHDPHATLIEKINERHIEKTKIWSVDLPSGLLVTGKPSQKIIQADIIFALHKPKFGTYNLGKTITLPIGIPLDAIIGSGPGYLQYYKSHGEFSHKGENGTNLLIGGSIYYHGAPVLSALAMLKTNIDLLTIIAPAEITSVIRQSNPEFIVHPYEYPYLCKEIVPEAINLIKNKSSLLLGPGIGDKPEVEEFVQLFINKWIKLTKKPSIVIDADALKFLKPVIGKLRQNIVLTPHAGEFESITGESLAPVKNLEERIVQVSKISRLYPITWLVKGKIDLIASKGKVIQNHTGCSAMTIGGTGDVLAGVTSGLLARYSDCFNSAISGAFWTGLTGEYLFSKNEIFSTLNLIKYLPIVWNELQRFNKEKSNIYMN
ncbi:MAG: Bifunctional NAD(P)H-hydrate repair enzyme Nnr [Candidatus Heimdallarchaeota archaeon LC_3]|nr:MAG: Bifunctional NAD(P)H-hydrate repair enzyme Nnr [Candidatus Heimdallarchaeota archaeon LC_3]